MSFNQANEVQQRLHGIPGFGEEVCRGQGSHDRAQVVELHFDAKLDVRSRVDQQKMERVSQFEFDLHHSTNCSCTRPSFPIETLFETVQFRVVNNFGSLQAADDDSGRDAHLFGEG